MDTPIIDHRGPEFQKLAKRVLDGIKTIFKTANPVIIYTATGTGAWEAALVNTLIAGDRVLMVETGQFAGAVEEHGREARAQAGIHRRPIGAPAPTPNAIEAHLREDKAHEIKAVCVLHNETSTGCRLADRRDPQGDRRRRPSGAAHGRHHLLARLDRLPPRRMGRRRHGRRRAEGADAAARHVVQRGERQGAGGCEDLEDAEVVLGMGGHARHEQDRLLPLHAGDPDAAGPRRGIDMLHEEGLDNVFARHDRLAEATRRAVRAWGLEIMCRDPKYYSPTITAVLLPDGPRRRRVPQPGARAPSTSPTARASAPMPESISASAISATSTTAQLMGALAGTEMALALAGIPHKKGGVQAAMDYLVSAHGSAARKAAE